MIKTDKNVYKKAYEKFGATPKGMKWHSQKSIDVRYKLMTTEIDFTDRSVFEVGCGAMGGILPYIKDKFTRFSYVGCDQMPEYVNESKKRFPGYEFIAGDFRDLIRASDIVVSSGAFNANIPNADRKKKFDIKMMFDYANETAAFNMSGGHPQPENSNAFVVYYADSLKILQFCLKLTDRLIYKSNYRPDDFTVILFK